MPLEGSAANWHRFFLGLPINYMSPDPAMRWQVLPGQYAAYSYARGNPLVYTDPTGQCPACVVVAEYCAINPVACAAAIDAAENALLAVAVAVAAVIVADTKPPFAYNPGDTWVGPNESRLYGPDGRPQTDVHTPHHNHPDETNHARDWGRNPDGTCDHNNKGDPRPVQPGDPPLPTNAR
jgi:hypothetical protein